jgi:UTP--glucose-1-phosphate uridylyltransferase
MKVVIPSAGLGTRFLPATKSMPKEMMPVLNRPVIQYVVEEAVAAGADDITIITGLLKRAVEDHFDHNPALGPTADNPEAAALESAIQKVTFHFIRQHEPRGLGDAVGCAERHIGAHPFGVLLGDSIHVAEPPLLSQLHETFERMGGRASVVALERVPANRVQNYGIVAGEEVAPRVVEISRLVEKPAPDDAPSRNAITGAYYFTPGIFPALRETLPDRRGEVQLTDAIQRLLTREKVYGLLFQGRRYDTGTPALWLETNIRFGWNHPSYRERIRALLKELEEESERSRS